MSLHNITEQIHTVYVIFVMLAAYVCLSVMFTAHLHICNIFIFSRDI